MRYLILLLVFISFKLSGQIRYSECYLENCDDNLEDLENVKFGYITVPEDYNNPNAKSIDVAFFLVKTTNPNPMPDPVIHVQGGWGSPMVWGVRGFVNSYPTLKDRDLIVMDPRGIGFSKPEICPEIASEFEIDISKPFSYQELIQRQVERQTECLVNLDFNFELYSSKHRASDYISLMRDLGYESYNLHGISYGTRVIQDILRQDQSMIRSVVLDSNIPVAHVKHGKHINYYYRTLSKILPAEDLLEFDEYLSQLGEDNLEVPLADSVAYINRQELNLLFQQMLYSDYYYDKFSKILSRIMKGDYQILSQYISNLLQDEDRQINGLAVINHVADWKVQRLEVEEIYRTSLVKYPNFEITEYLLPFYLQDTLFSVDPMNAIPVTSDVQTLIMTGELDPSTPPETSEILLPRFTNNYYFVISGGGHAVSMSACGENLMMQFIEDPQTKPDHKCIH